MELNVTDRASSENDRYVSEAFILGEESDDTVMLKKVTLRFVNAILDFNPDATEQLDLGEKHVANVENLGDQVRKKSGSLIREMNEVLSGINTKFKDSSWISGNLKAISKTAREMEPFRYQLTETGMIRFLEKIPFISTPYRRYFALFESMRGEVELLIRHLNRLTGIIEKDNETLEGHKTALRDQCIALVKSVYMGNMINKKLGSALEKDMTDDDPRKFFIETEILARLKTRLKNLGLQRELNKTCLEALLIVIENNKELLNGLVTVRESLISSYHLGRKTAKALVQKDIPGITLDDAPLSDEDTKFEAGAYGFQGLSDALLDIPFKCQTILDFINRAEPVISGVLEVVPKLQSKTDNAFLRASMAHDDITKM